VPAGGPGWGGARQEEDVDKDIEAEGGEGVAGVVVVPHADLDRRHDGGVEEQDAAEEHLALHEGRERVDEPAGGGRR
jgi:hypothetical protein